MNTKAEQIEALTRMIAAGLYEIAPQRPEDFAPIPKPKRPDPACLDRMYDRWAYECLRPRTN